MNLHVGFAFFFAALLALPAEATACSRSIVEPGNNTTDPVHTMKRGTSCAAYFDLEGWEIHSMRVVQQPRNGRISFQGRNRYVYTAGAKPGLDELVIELDTTQHDWFTGARQSRSRWQVKTPFRIE
jgi:hypothetical protein